MDSDACYRALKVSVELNWSRNCARREWDSKSDAKHEMDVHSKVFFTIEAFLPSWRLPCFTSLRIKWAVSEHCCGLALVQCYRDCPSGTPKGTRVEITHVIRGISRQNSLSLSILIARLGQKSRIWSLG